MQNFSYHVPIYIVTGGVATSGHSADLRNGELGLFDIKTFSVATGAGNGKEFFFSQGDNSGLDFYGEPVNISHKSAFFLGKDVKKIYKSIAQAPINEEWVIGYNGSPSSKSLTFKKGVATRVKLYFHGEPTYRFWNGPKEMVISYTPVVECDEPCTSSDCPEEITDILYHTQQLINNINNSTEARKFGVTAKLVDSAFEAATPNMTKHCLTVCDNGDALALQAVASQVSAEYDVVRIARSGSSSTYQICIPTTDPDPAAFQQSGSVLQAVCGECPAGSTLVAAADVYQVRRVIAVADNLTSPAARQTYANTVTTAYSGTNGVFVGTDGNVAIVEFKRTVGAATTAINSDVLDFKYSVAAQCTFAAPASIAWSECGVGIRAERTLTIKNINRPDCDSDGNRIADLTVALQGVKGIQLGTLAVVAGDACKDDYTVRQWSDDCLAEGCQTSNVTFSYAHVPAFENEQWEVVPATVDEVVGRKTGIRVTAGYVDPQFGNCSASPFDYYNMEPLKMEVSLLGELDGVCEVANWPTVSQSRIGQIGRQSGEWAVREVILKNKAYLKHVDQFSGDPRMREAFNQTLLDSVDRKAYYDVYYITFLASYGHNTTYRKGEQEKFTAVFAFKQGDPVINAFETNIVNVLSAKSGVIPEVVGNKTGGSSGQQLGL